MNHTYYVTYTYEKGTGAGIGTCTSKIKNPIRNYSDISSVAESIKQHYRYDNVIVLSWVEIEDEEAQSNGRS